MAVNRLLATDIGERLRELRKAMDWSQRQLGDEVGRHWQQVSSWEGGKTKPSLGMLDRLAKKHGWPAEIFLEGGPMPSVAIRRREKTPLAVRESGVDYLAGAEGIAEGDWPWSTEQEVDEGLRTVLKNVERTIRGMVSDSASLRDIRLAVCRSVMRQFELTGRPVPEAVHKIYNEVIEGRL